MARLRPHLPLVAVLVLAGALRIAAWIAYRPALMYSDSWGYLHDALHGTPVGISAIRPAGYPIALRILNVFGTGLGGMTAVQHVAGLVTAVLVYAVVRRAGAGPWLGAVAAALFGLDAYAVALEQHLLAETFFTLALMLGLWLTVAGRGRWALPLAGVAIAVAVSMRTVGICVVPVWLIYLAWSRVGWRRGGAAVAALALPLLLYGALHDVKTGQFGLTQGNGWMLYARVGQIADCRGIGATAAERPLCEPAHGARVGASFYLWSHRSPARRLFPSGPAGPTLARSDALLGGFAEKVILAHPTRYLGLVAADFARFFKPGLMARGDQEDLPETFPASPRAEDRLIERPVRAQDAPGFRIHVRAPAAALRAYARVVHTPRWLLIAFVLAAVAATVARAARARWPVHGREAYLAAGMGAALLLGAAAGSEFSLRLLMPAVPLLICGGVVALRDGTAALGPIPVAGRLRRVAQPGFSGPAPGR